MGAAVNYIQVWTWVWQLLTIMITIVIINIYSHNDDDDDQSIVACLQALASSLVFELSLTCLLQLFGCSAAASGAHAVY